jgi:prolyl-tRNA editing enzyme YbaK/EbsC (Cys-tRNA(Pro) deacylase)
MDSSQKRVLDILAQHNLQVVVKEFDEHTKTSQAAADVLGCTVSEIAKSIILTNPEGTQGVLVIASGSNRVSTQKVENLVGFQVRKANADEVKKFTGFVIGAVAPVGHFTDMTILIDPDLLQYPKVWAAAGTQNSVFSIKPQEIVDITQGKVVDVKE